MSSQHLLSLPWDSGLPVWDSGLPVSELTILIILVFVLSKHITAKIENIMW